MNDELKTKLKSLVKKLSSTMSYHEFMVAKEEIVNYIDSAEIGCCGGKCHK